MQTERPYALTIAGLDPCSGAGLTADIKTFEQLKVYGLAVCSGITRQTESKFESVDWRDLSALKKDLALMLQTYPIAAVKFGIVPSLSVLEYLTDQIHGHNADIKIVVDPVWKSSSGFSFHEQYQTLSETFLKKITLLTPNLPELEWIAQKSETNEVAMRLSEHSGVLLKGGHQTHRKGVDTLYQKNKITEIPPGKEGLSAKHGSGCVLSAAITAYLCKGFDLTSACVESKKYIETFLNSNKSLLGYHVA